MRGRRVLGLLFVLALVVSACGDDDATTTTAAADLTQTAGVLTVGSDIPYPPFEDFDADGNVIGFDAELITEIADRLGLTVEWVDTDFDTIFTQLATGRFDVVISASSITPERAAQVNFTDTYYLSQQAFTVNTALTPTIESTDDLQAGDSVAVQTATTGADWATANLAPRGVEVREFSVIGDAYNAVESGQVTGVVSDEPSAVAEVGNRADIAIVQVIDTDEHYGIAVDPERTALLDAINDALADMLADGTYQTIYDAWFDAPAGSVLYLSPPVTAIGTPDNPIQILFAPIVPADALAAGAEILVNALQTATGLSFTVAVPPTYADTVRAMCASPDDTIGILPAEVFVVAADLCGVTPALKALRFGYSDYWTEIVVARDSDLETIADLDGLRWAYPDAGSTAGHLIPRGMFATSAVTPGSAFEAGNATDAVAAVYDGTADFATVRFAPNIDEEGNPVWDLTLATADIPDDLIDDCALSEGDLVCGSLRPRDARRGLREEHPDVIAKVRILAISDPIPNELVAFGADFPQDARAEIVAAFVEFSTQDPEGFLAAFEILVWDGVEVAGDSDVAWVRALLSALGFDIAQL